jgi:hypothetical protein
MRVRGFIIVVAMGRRLNAAAHDDFVGSLRGTDKGEVAGCQVRTQQ